ncbi:MAG: tRNA pseudouridine(13) synthase TruD [Halothiobacillaceae bacterium]
MALAPPFAFGGPVICGVIRSDPEDFVVEELLGFAPDGEGTHLWLWLEKTGQNTEWLARQIARAFSVHPRDVGYAGLKDRHAVTRQWFSVPTTEDADHLEAADLPGVRLLSATRHGRKLRRGAHAGNRFEIRVRQVSGRVSDLAGRLTSIQSFGVPNYFTGQRFGREGNNIDRAVDWLAARKPVRLPRDKQSRNLSVARSVIFNVIAADRVEQGSWYKPQPGDRLILAGSRSQFTATEEELSSLLTRAEAGDLSPTGPLWGSGESGTQAAVAAREARLAETCSPLNTGLENQRIAADRRPLRLAVSDLTMHVAEDAVDFRFSLPSGGFALAVLRELVEYSEPEHFSP